MEKRLYRSRTDRMFTGVCGGLGNYFNIDPTLVRLVAVVLGFISFGTALLVYLVMAVVMPLEPETGQAATPAVATPATPATTQAAEPAVTDSQTPVDSA